MQDRNSNNSIKDAEKISSNRPGKIDSYSPYSEYSPNKKAKLPLGSTLFIGLIMLVGAFLAGNRLPLIHVSDLRHIGRHAETKGQLDMSSVKQLHGQLQKYYAGELDAEKLTNGMKAGMVEATGDPYTRFFTSEQAQDFQDELNGDYSGIGVEIGIKDNKLVVIAPVDGTPAQQAGVRAGDNIIGVDGHDTSQWSITEAASKIKGDAGTKVKLTIIRGSQTLNLEITRADISVPSVKYSIKDDNIGYLKISRFDNDTVSLANEAAQSFKSKGIRAVVLDLRDNGGGLLHSAVGVSSLWLEDEVVVSEKAGSVTRQTLRSHKDAPLKDLPLIVLVNGGSASASEITAGALRDNGVAKIFGETTYGKGSVQELVKLKNGGMLKVTVAHWFTPQGININEKGLTPDTKIKLTTDDFNASRDPQLSAALEALND